MKVCPDCQRVDPAHTEECLVGWTEVDVAAMLRTNRKQRRKARKKKDASGL